LLVVIRRRGCFRHFELVFAQTAWLDQDAAFLECGISFLVRIPQSGSAKIAQNMRENEPSTAVRRCASNQKKRLFSSHSDHPVAPREDMLLVRILVP
jgi:hypothetical protein